MAREIRYRGKIRATCSNCKNKYDLHKAADAADKRNSSNIRCPNCNNLVGRSS